MRIGLVGYGKGGRFFHAPLISSLPGATFVGVVTRSVERRQQLASDYPHVQAFDTLAELVAAGIDAVVVSTPLDGRPAVVMEAIELGVAVVSDKPFARDAAQAEAMVVAAERCNVPLCVYQNRRWDSDYLTLRKLLASGALGRSFVSSPVSSAIHRHRLAKAAVVVSCAIWAAIWWTRRCNCSGR